VLLAAPAGAGIVASDHGGGSYSMTRSAAGAAEAAGAAIRRTETVDQLDARPRDRREDELRDPIAALDAEGLRSRVAQDHADLSAGVAVDGARRAHARDSVMERRAR